jgi:hypothetical protein
MQMILTGASNNGSQRVIKEVLLKGAGQGATGENINIATFWDNADLPFPSTAVHSPSERQLSSVL